MLSMTRCRLLASLAGVTSTWCGLAVSGSAIAQTADASDEHPQTAEKGEIIVTARRKAEQLKDVPVAVTLLDSDALRTKRIETQQDLQRAAPGLVVRPLVSRNSFNFAIRGQAVDSASGSQAAVLPYVNEFQATAFGPSALYDLSSIQVVKGPQGTQFGRNTTGGAVLITTTAPSFDRIEGFGKVEFGNYGKNAVQAAINIPLSSTLAIRLAGDRTRQNGYIQNIITDEHLNSTNRSSIRGSVLWKPSDAFESRTVAEYMRSRGNGDANIAINAYPVGATGPAPYNFALNTTAATFYTPFLDTAVATPGAFAALLAQLSPLTPACGVLCAVDQQRARGPYRVALDGPFGSRAHNLYVTNTSTYSLSDQLQLKNIVGYSDSFATDFFDVDGTPFPIAKDEMPNSIKQWSEEFQISGKTISNHLSYQIGYYHYYERKFNATIFTVLDLGPIGNALTGLPSSNNIAGTQRSENDSFYANVEQAFAGNLEGLKLSAGFRYTWEKIRFVENSGYLPAFPPGVREGRSDARPSWQIGVQYDLTRDLMVYATHRGSWRSGGFNFVTPPVELIGSLGGNMFLPEKVKDVELGAKFQGDVIGASVTLNVALFKQWVDDVQRTALIFVPASNGFANVTYNVPGGAQYKGVEVELNVKPAEWLELGLSYAYNDAKYGKPNTANLFNSLVVFDTFADLLKNSGSAYAQVSLPLQHLGALVLRGDVYAQSKQFISNSISSNPGAVLPSHTLVNLRASLDNVAGSNFSLSAYVTNLTNRKYYVGGVGSGSQLGLNAAVPGQPRFAGIELRYDF